VVVVCAATSARADNSLSEIGDRGLALASHASETACDLDVELRGGIADVEVREHLSDPGDQPRALALELELPAGATIVGFARDRGDALAVPASAEATLVGDRGVLDVDPAFVTALPDTAAGHARFRAVLQPGAERGAWDTTIVTRWTAPVEIAGGALRLVLPGHRVVPLAACRGVVHATPGPGATIDRIRVDDAETAGRAATFTLGADDVAITATMAFARPEPLVWSTTEPLPGGFVARAVTVVAPPGHPAPRRALLVIDSSRSMDLIGGPAIARVVAAIGGALPAGSEVEAITFDRMPARVLGAWRPAGPDALAAIEAAIGKHAGANGSDLASALALAHRLLGEGSSRLPAQVIVIGDGVLAQAPDGALASALAAAPRDLDLHAIVLDPGALAAPGKAALDAAIDHFGGAYVELRAGDLDRELADVASWLEPAWRQLAVTGVHAELPDELRAGSGFSRFELGRRPTAVRLVAKGEHAASVAASAAPAAAVAQLALARTGVADFLEPSWDLCVCDGELAKATAAREQVVRRTPIADDAHALAVLASTGRVAASRHAMVAGGGPYTRTVALLDPEFPADPAPPAATGVAADGAIVSRTLQLQLQPLAYACYQRALGRTPGLAGTVLFQLEVARGEVTRADVSAMGNPAFEGCLLDAAYQLALPLPDPRYTGDDGRAIVRYPLTFTVRAEHPIIVPGDADSESPLDIDAIKGGAPGPRSVDAGDTKTPLGTLRPPPSP